MATQKTFLQGRWRSLRRLTTRAVPSRTKARRQLSFEALDPRLLLSATPTAPLTGPPGDPQPHQVETVDLRITVTGPGTVKQGQHVGYVAHDPYDGAGNAVPMDPNWTTYFANSATNEVSEAEFQYLETAQFLVGSDGTYQLTINPLPHGHDDSGFVAAGWTGALILHGNADPVYRDWGSSWSYNVSASAPVQLSVVPCKYVPGKVKEELVSNPWQTYSVFISREITPQMHKAALLTTARKQLQQTIKDGYRGGHSPYSSAKAWGAAVRAQAAVVRTIQASTTTVLKQSFGWADCVGANQSATAADKNFWTAVGGGNLSAGKKSGLVRPQYAWDKKTGNLSYNGTMCSPQARNRGINLYLNPAVTVSVPLTNLRASWNGQIKAAPGYSQQTLEETLDYLVEHRLSSFDYADAATKATIETLKVTFPDGFKMNSWTSRIKGQVRIGGYGRIDGSAFNQWTTDTTPTGPQKQEQTSDGQSYLLVDVLKTLEFTVGSGLLDISSAYKSDNATNPAIDIWGVAVSQGAKRGHGAINLNTPWNNFRDADPNANNNAVKLFDVKAIANWKDASDGPEAMGANSLVQYVYIHTADDSIKAAVSGLTVEHATVLQGNVGGVVDFGSYGYSRPQPGASFQDNPWVVSGISLSEVAVHRVTQINGGYDGLNGLFTTRNAAFDHSYSGYGGNIIDVSLSGFRVADLGGIYIQGDGLKGSNSFYRAYALGFLPDGAFSSRNPSDHAETWFKDWTFTFRQFDSDYLVNCALVKAHNSLDASNTDSGNFYNKPLAGTRFGEFWNIRYVPAPARRAM
jgi:hypothetical protein